MLESLLHPKEIGLSSLEGFVNPQQFVAPFVFHTALNTPSFENGLPGSGLAPIPKAADYTHTIGQETGISPFIAPYEAPTTGEVEWGLNNWRNACEADPSLAEHFNQQHSFDHNWESKIEYRPAIPDYPSNPEHTPTYDPCLNTKTNLIGMPQHKPITAEYDLLKSSEYQPLSYTLKPEFSQSPSLELPELSKLDLNLKREPLTVYPLNSGGEIHLHENRSFGSIKLRNKTLYTLNSYQSALADHYLESLDLPRKEVFCKPKTDLFERYRK